MIILFAETDILIVGSGPAGSVTARYAAEQGLKVTFIEQRPEVGVPVRCGELVPSVEEIQGMFPNLTDAESLFDMPDSLKRRQIEGIRLTDPKGRDYNFPFTGYTTDRDRFDQPMTITITSDVPKAEIRYTVDGSTPDANSPLYKKPFVISNSTYVKAKAFKADATPSFTTVKRYNFDYIESAAFVNKPNTPYNYNQETILFDGETGEISELSRGWLGFSGNDLNVVFQLSKAIELQQVVTRFAHVPDAWAFAPTAVQVYVSSDGVNYSPAINAKLNYAPEEQSMNSPQLVTLTVEVNQPDVKFVRLVAKNLGRIPAWHKARGLKPWIMIDEVELDEVIR